VDASHGTLCPTDEGQLDPRRIFDGVPYRQPRNKEGLESATSSWSRSSRTSSTKPSKDKISTKAAKDKSSSSKDRARADKENAQPSPSPSPHGLLEKDRTRSSAALGLNRLAARGHNRSQSQSHAEDSAKGSLQTRRQGAIQMPSLLGLGTLSPQSPSPAKHGVRPAASTGTFRGRDKENQHVRGEVEAGLQQSPSGQHEKDESARLGSVRKPLGPRKPSPPGSPVFKAPEKDGGRDKDKERKGRVLSDRTRVNQENRENVAGGSVRDRMREWERERQRLRELERAEERRREEEAEQERAMREEEEEEEMHRDMERQRMLELELDRQREHEFGMERARVQVARERERQRELEAQLEREREELERQRVRGVQTYHQAYPPVSIRRSSTSTPPDTVPPTPLSPLIEGMVV
jgi:hypothetical protein